MHVHQLAIGEEMSVCSVCVDLKQISIFPDQLLLIISEDIANNSCMIHITQTRSRREMSGNILAT